VTGVKVPCSGLGAVAQALSNKLLAAKARRWILAFMVNLQDSGAVPTQVVE
jgi:hypothetical protein